MPDREKVMKGLEHCMHIDTVFCADCPYDYADSSDCVVELAKNALELLKVQEAKIERLEHDLSVAENNLNYFVNGNN